MDLIIAISFAEKLEVGLLERIETDSIPKISMLSLGSISTAIVSLLFSIISLYITNCCCACSKKDPVHALFSIFSLASMSWAIFVRVMVRKMIQCDDTL